MMNNHSVPADIMASHIEYQNLPDAIAWLSRAFGFGEQYRYGDPLSGAQMMLGKACVWCGRLDRTKRAPRNSATEPRA